MSDGLMILPSIDEVRMMNDLVLQAHGAMVKSITERKASYQTMIRLGRPLEAEKIFEEIMFIGMTCASAVEIAPNVVKTKDPKRLLILKLIEERREERKGNNENR